MNKKINGKNVKIFNSKFEAANITSKDVEKCLKKFVGKGISKKLAKRIMKIFYAREELILRVDQRSYMLKINDGCPVFEEIDLETTISDDAGVYLTQRYLEFIEELMI